MAPITTSYETKSGDESALAAAITPTQTSGIKIAAMNLNGNTATAWANTDGGVIQIDQEVDGTRKVEWIAYGGGTVNSDNSFTLTDVSRDVPRDGTTLTGTGTGQRFNKGAAVKFVTFHYLLNKKANVDRANTFTANQRIAEDIELEFANANTYIRKSAGSNALRFKDADNSEITLSQLAAAAGLDEKVKVTSDDTTGDYLENKMSPGEGIALTSNVYEAAYLTGGTDAEDDFAVWENITDGSFRITLNGGPLNVDGIDFTGVLDMDEVAGVIEDAITAALGGLINASVSWDVDHFLIESLDETSSSGISVLTTSTGTVGTDISGAGASDWMDCDTGNGVVTDKVATDGRIDVAVDLAENPGLQFDDEKLEVRLKENGGLQKDADGLSVVVADLGLTEYDYPYGDGSDGAKNIAASEDLNPATQFDYTTFTLAVSQTMSVTSTNSPLIVRVSGDATINGTIDLNAKGAAAATAGASKVSGWTTTQGSAGANTAVNGQNTSGGGGGGSALEAGVAGTNGTASGGAGGAALTPARLAWLTAMRRHVACGAGGAAGGTGGSGKTGGAGGIGGGAMLMLIGGDLTLGAASVIRANGADGSAGVGGGGSVPAGSGGGGGGGGTIFIIVRGSITNGGVTVSATPGSGGAAGGDGNGNGVGGGAGGAGKVIIYSIADGTIITA